MRWTDALLQAAHALNFDLHIVLSQHPTIADITLCSFTSNMTFDNHIRHLPNSPDGKCWWLAKGPKPTDPNIFNAVPWIGIIGFKTQQEAQDAVHKGKRIVSLNYCGHSAKTIGDPSHPYIYAVPDDNSRWSSKYTN